MLDLVRKLKEWLHPRVTRNTQGDRLITPPKPTKTVEFLKDRKGEWRWRVRASNGEIIGASSEGYSSRRACEKNLRTLITVRF